MEKSYHLFAALLVGLVSLAGCQMIGDIFKAGVWVGVILVIGVIGIIAWIVAKSTG